MPEREPIEHGFEMGSRGRPGSRLHGDPLRHCAAMRHDRSMTWL
jgi:hypothetical protein